MPRRGRAVLAGLVLLTALPAACGHVSQGPARIQIPKPRPYLYVSVLARIDLTFGNDLLTSTALEHWYHNDRWYALDRRSLTGLGDDARTIDDLTFQDVDAIVIDPPDPASLLPAVQRASAAGILVVNVRDRFDPAELTRRGLKVPFLGVDHRAGAQALAERLVATRGLARGDRVIVLTDRAETRDGPEVSRGYDEALEAAGLTAERIVHSTLQESADAVSQALAARPETRAVLCVGDRTLSAAVKGRKAAGRTSAHVALVGYGRSFGWRREIADGTVLAIADPHPELLAPEGLDYVLKALKVKPGAVPPGDILRTAEIVAADNPPPPEPH